MYVRAGEERDVETVGGFEKPEALNKEIIYWIHMFFHTFFELHKAIFIDFVNIN